MNALLITYDLHKMGQRYQALRKLILENFPTYWNCLESTFIVVTSMTAGQVATTLSSALDGNDELFVVALQKTSWASIGLSKECSDWLHKNA